MSTILLQTIAQLFPSNAIIDLMRRVFATIIGMYELLRIAVQNRFRINNPYWKWRYETAFGTDPAKRPSRRAQLRSMIDYGVWVNRMRRRHSS